MIRTSTRLASVGPTGRTSWLWRKPSSITWIEPNVADLVEEDRLAVGDDWQAHYELR